MNVQLVSAGPKKIQVIKVVRELTNWGLKEAKEWVDNAPSSAIEVEPALAEGVADALRTAGATVEISGATGSGGGTGSGGSAAQPASGSAGAPSIADELEELASLRDRGILTDEEFAAAKTRVLGIS